MFLTTNLTEEFYRIQMANFTFRNKDTQEVYDLSLSFAERDKYLEDNPNVEQLITGSPSFIYDNYNFMNKVPSGFRDVLKQIKKQNPNSTIDCGNIGSQ